MNIENALARYIDYGSKIELIERDIPVSDNSNFIKALVGPRRAGKSSMMLILMQKLRKKGITPIFINGEDIDFVGITPENLDKIEDTIYKVYALSASKPVYLFIDEVQSFPEWSRWLRTLFDENKYNIFVSGSTSELTSDALPSELRGRSLETIVLPFSFKEYCTAKGLVYKKFMNTEQKGAIIKALSEYIDFGGYPEVVKESDDDSKKSILANLYATVLQHDIIEKYRIRKINEFKIFINAVFGSACRNISVPKIVHWFEGQRISINNQT
ncbi:MAG: ATP-binding protein, partial [Candidatus Micrarchaeia archaeon]